MRRKAFSDTVVTSFFYSDGEDSDAQFHGCDVREENKTQNRRHRRKVNSPASVRAPNFDGYPQLSSGLFVLEAVNAFLVM